MLCLILLVGCLSRLPGSHRTPNIECARLLLLSKHTCLQVFRQASQTVIVWACFSSLVRQRTAKRTGFRTESAGGRAVFAATRGTSRLGADPIRYPFYLSKLCDDGS